MPRLTRCTRPASAACASISRPRGESDPDVARRNLMAAVDRVASRGWHVQVYTRLSVVTGLVEDCEEPADPDRVRPFRRGAGGRRRRRSRGSPICWNWSARGHAYVKISASYRSSTKAPAYDDVAPLARALIAANPDRIVWGTDWPHPHHAPPGAPLDEIAPSYDIDDGLALNQLREWAPDPAIRHKILVDNPARLYDY